MKCREVNDKHCSECGRCVAEDLVPHGKPLCAMAESLALPSSVKDRAYALYERVVVKDCNPDSLKAACLYIACKRFKQPRTLKELATVAEGSTEDEIKRAIDCLARKQQRCIPVGILSTYCYNLGMSREASKAAFQVLKNAEIPEYARSGMRTCFGLVAAAIYLISLVSSREEDKKSLSDVLRVTKTTEETITECLDILRPQAARVVPEWYCKPEDVKVQ